MATKATKKYCDVCNAEVTNWHAHIRTKKHVKNSIDKEGLNDENTDTRNGIEFYQCNEETTSRNDNEGNKIMPPEIPIKENMQETKENNSTITGIQIIDSSGNKKDSLDRLLDIAFSEQFAPITMSLLAGIANKLNGTANNEQSEGNFVTTVSGAKIKVHGDF
jgi:hypothetical protein